MVGDFVGRKEKEAARPTAHGQVRGALSAPTNVHLGCLFERPAPQAALYAFDSRGNAWRLTDEIQDWGKRHRKTSPNVPPERSPGKVRGLDLADAVLQVRRREVPHFALPRINLMLLFYGVSEIFLRRRQIPL